MARLDSNPDGPYLPVGSRFCDLRPLGYGSSGMVFSAVDGECDKSVAIKRIALADKKSCRASLREIRILRKLQHENIVKIYDVIFGGDSESRECEEEVSAPSEIWTLCIVQELVDTDLRHVIEHQRLANEHVRLFAYQLLRGLKYLHSANVLHRDLKPENVLINQEDLVLKIGDFGMARIVDPNYSHKGYLTQNVSTQWYRSPELVLQPSDYTKAIDVWSAGCIVAEMLLGKPLFPGDHDLELMMLILDSVLLNDRDLNEILCTLPSKLLKNYNGFPKHPLKDMLCNLDVHALSLLLGMLTFDPAERITAEEALDSPYFKMYSCFLDEPIAKQPFCIESEVDDLPPITIKKLILEECRDRTDMETLFAMENVNVFEGDEENINNDTGFTKTSSEDGNTEKYEVLADSCIDNAFFKRVDSCGNKQSESSEKSENEESEKSDDEEKEGKSEDWKDGYRKSLNNLEELQEREGEAVEKGSVESDSEGSEKSETDVSQEKSNKQEEDLEKGLKEEPQFVKCEECNKTDNKDEKKIEGAMWKGLKAGIDSMDVTLEKAFEDKLQKEKLNEQLSNREWENVSVRKKESNENKELDVTDAEDVFKQDVLKEPIVKDVVKEEMVKVTVKDTVKDTVKEDTVKDIMKDSVKDTVKEDVAKEKTLEDCLELGSLKLNPDTLTTNNQFLPNEHEHDQGKTIHGPDFKDKSLFLEQILTDNDIKCNDNIKNSQKPLCNSQTGKEHDLPQKPDLKQVLYVDIPKAASTTSPRGSPRGLGKEASRRTSPTTRERSVRPKKKDWFYSKH